MFENIINSALGNNYNGFSRMWAIIGDIAYVILRAKCTVACKKCGQEYESYERYAKEIGERPRTIQGNNLCAWVKYKPDRFHGKWAIHCGYGSDFDLSEFWFVKDFPHEEIDGVCDWCIRRWVKEGTLMDCGRIAIIDNDYSTHIEHILADPLFRKCYFRASSRRGKKSLSS